MNTSEFQDWLELSTDLADKTINNYVRAMRKICSDVDGIDQIPSPQKSAGNATELTRIRDSYFSISEYAELDQRGNRMYSAAFTYQLQT